jgi:hypothetical protein
MWFFWTVQGVVKLRCQTGEELQARVTFCVAGTYRQIFYTSLDKISPDIYLLTYLPCNRILVYKLGEMAMTIFICSVHMELFVIVSIKQFCDVLYAIRRSLLTVLNEISLEHSVYRTWWDSLYCQHRSNIRSGNLASWRLFSLTLTSSCSVTMATCTGSRNLPGSNKLWNPGMYIHAKYSTRESKKTKAFLVYFKTDVGRTEKDGRYEKLVFPHLRLVTFCYLWVAIINTLTGLILLLHW